MQRTGQQIALALALMLAFAPCGPSAAATTGADDAVGEGQAEEDVDDIIALHTELFEEKDADGDQELDPDEFRAMLLEDIHPDERMGEREVAAIFHQADLDENKRVSLQEWMANYFQGNPQVAQYRDGEEIPHEDAPSDAEDTRLHARQEFDRLDSDGSGYLNNDEILALLRATASHSPYAAGAGGKQGVSDNEPGQQEDGAGKEPTSGLEPDGPSVGRVWGEENERDMEKLAVQMVRDLDINRDRLVRYARLSCGSLQNAPYSDVCAYRGLCSECAAPLTACAVVPCSFSEFFGPEGIKDLLQGGADGAENFSIK
jgi:Ca2+-binding EF-hand superfamily protein